MSMDGGNVLVYRVRELQSVTSFNGRMTGRPAERNSGLMEAGRAPADGAGPDRAAEQADRGRLRIHDGAPQGYKKQRPGAGVETPGHGRKHGECRGRGT